MSCYQKRNLLTGVMTVGNWHQINYIVKVIIALRKFTTTHTFSNESTMHLHDPSLRPICVVHHTNIWEVSLVLYSAEWILDFIAVTITRFDF